MGSSYVFRTLNWTKYLLPAETNVCASCFVNALFLSMFVVLFFEEGKLINTVFTFPLFFLLGSHVNQAEEAFLSLICVFLLTLSLCFCHGAHNGSRCLRRTGCGITSLFSQRTVFGCTALFNSNILKPLVFSPGDLCCAQGQDEGYSTPVFFKQAAKGRRWADTSKVRIKALCKCKNDILPEKRLFIS